MLLSASIDIYPPMCVYFTCLSGLAALNLTTISSTTTPAPCKRPPLRLFAGCRVFGVVGATLSNHPKSRDGKADREPKTAWLHWPGVLNRPLTHGSNGCCRDRNGNAERLATDKWRSDKGHVSFPATFPYNGRFNLAPVGMRRIGVLAPTGGTP